MDNRGIHLGLENFDSSNNRNVNVEKASVMLLSPQNSLKDKLVNDISPIFATASNGAWGTGGSSIVGGATNNGYIFGNSALGLLVGSLAEGSKTDFTGGTGQGYAVFLGLRNGVVDVTKTPESKGQPIIYDLSHAGDTDKKRLPGTALNTTESSGPIAIGAYNSITGNSGLAVGSLNRVYGNGGVVVGTTSVADAYSSVGRFGVTMGFNVKNGEWSQQSVAIGANLQAVGSGNIILGGGTDKYYGASHWQGADEQVETTTNGVYTTLGNVFNNDTISNAGMRFFGDRNIVLGAKNRTEGFNPNVGGVGYGGNAGNGSYTRIADNAITGANNSIRDLSFRNSVYGSNNIVTAGIDNMIIGSGNDIQAAYNGTLNYSGGSASGVVKDAQTIGNLWRVSITGSGNTARANPSQLFYGDSNSIIGSRNLISYNTGHNFVAGADNFVYQNSSYNFLAGSKNIAGLDLASTDAQSMRDLVKKLLTGIKIPNPNTTIGGTIDAETLITTSDSVEDVLEKFLKFKLSVGEQTGLNLLAGSFNIAGKSASNNIVQGSNVILRNDVTGSYVFGSHVDVTESHSVYIGDYSVANLRPYNLMSGTDYNYTFDYTTPLTTLNQYSTAGETGQSSITINGVRYDFAGRGISGESGVITVGRIVENPLQSTGSRLYPADTNYASLGRVIQNVAPGLISARSTDAINGSQLYALWDFVKKYTINIVTGNGGSTVTTNVNPLPADQNSGSTSGTSTTGTSTTGTAAGTGSTAGTAAGSTAGTAAGSSSASTENYSPNTFNVHTEQIVSYVNEQGDKLVKAADGKFYKESDTNGMVMYSNRWFRMETTIDPTDGSEIRKLVEVETNIPQQQTPEENTARLHNANSDTPDVPVVLENVASGLGLTGKTGIAYDKILNSSEQDAALEAAKTQYSVSNISDLNETQRKEALDNAVYEKMKGQLSTGEKNTILANAANSVGGEITTDALTAGEKNWHYLLQQKQNILIWC